MPVEEKISKVNKIRPKPVEMKEVAFETCGGSLHEGLQKV